MAITNIVLSDNRTSASGGNKRITAAHTPSALYVKFRTIDKDSQAKIDLAIAYEFVARGDVRGGDDYGGYVTSGGSTKWWYRQFDVSGSDVWVSERDALVPGYLWSLPLDFTSTDPTSSGTSIVSALTNGDWSFANRKYDAIHLHIKVKTLYYVGSTLTASDVSHADRYIGYIPTYTATGASLTTSGLHVTYSSPDWDRSSDRWEVTRLRQGTRDVTSTKSKPWGQVAGAGAITIPRGAISYVPEDGTLSGEIRMNATWRPAGEEFASMSFTGLAFENNAEANTPSVTRREDADSGIVSVTVTDSGDEDVSLSTALVTLVGGGLASDSQTIPIGGTATFAPPIGEGYTISCIGFASDGTRAKRAANVSGGPVSVGDVGGGVVISDADGESTIHVIRDTDVSETVTPEAETVKLAGRRRPSVFYGEGGTHDMTVRGTVFVEDGHGVPSVSLDWLRGMPEWGPVVVRDCLGTRMLARVTSVTIANEARVKWARSVTIALEEVA